MNQRNPLLNNIHKPFTELFELLPQLTTGKLKHSDAYTFTCHANVLNAVDRHLNNMDFIVNEGIKAISELLGKIDSKELHDETINDIGWFLHLISDLRCSSDQLKSEIDYALAIKSKK